MKGPATRMYEACCFSSENVLVRWAEDPEHGAIRAGCASAIRDVTYSQLLAMDYSAEVVSDSTLDGVEAWVGGLPSTESDERAMLRVLLDRASKRRADK